MTLSGLLVLALGGVFAIRSFGSDDGNASGAGAGNCDEPIRVTVAVAPELQPQIEAAAKSLHGRGEGGACAIFKVSATSSAEVASAVAIGDKNRPDLWVPDSTLWVARADDGQMPPAVAVPSLASSPLVLVGTEESFATRGSWLEVFGKAQANLLDPLTTSAGAGALLAIQAERTKTSASDPQVAQVLVPLAQRHGSLAKPYTDIEGLFNQAAAGDGPVVIPATEQAFVRFQQKRPDSGLQALVPSTGTLALDYPMVVTAKDNANKVGEAGKRLAQELRADAPAQALDQAGFRSTTNDPLSGGRGVGEITLLTKPETPVAQKTLQRWATLALSSHSLLVIDASSSMLTPVGNTTWMDVTTQTAQAGVRLFPGNAQLGLWVLSTKVSGPNRDWAPLVPIRPLDTRVGAGTQRQELVRQVGAMKAKVGGSTGLFDALLAAYRTVQDGYDQRSVNAVVFFTDGFSPNVRGLSLADTLKTLQHLRDPARPVRVIMIGMGPNVDTAALEQIARTTGGRNYLARTPADIKQVFIDAVGSR
ncbi:MAG: substrate-binding domain-containing protein [Kribbellaceae bacterium]|nr:substrate-binding domain-containing protein [Kribbellaceae bacterium]